LFHVCRLTIQWSKIQSSVQSDHFWHQLSHFRSVTFRRRLDLMTDLLTAYTHNS
jgi:hypothetical protein